MAFAEFVSLTSPTQDIFTLMEIGWIKLFRKMKESALWKKSQYAHLWVHILLSVNREKTEVIFNGKTMTLNPGQFLTGRTSLTVDTRIPGSTVERILKYLENGHLIGQQKTNKFRIITVNEWDKYQGLIDKGGQGNGQQADNKRTTSGQQSGHKQEDKREYKKVNNIKKEESFVSFWELYPRRKGTKLGKKQCQEFWNEIKEENIEMILTGVKNYAESQQVKSGYAKDPIRFLRHEIWQDFQEAEESEFIREIKRRESEKNDT